MQDIRVELSDEAAQRHRPGGRERQDLEPAQGSHDGLEAGGIWPAGTGGR